MAFKVIVFEADHPRPGFLYPRAAPVAGVAAGRVVEKFLLNVAVIKIFYAQFLVVKDALGPLVHLHPSL